MRFPMLYYSNSNRSIDSILSPGNNNYFHYFFSLSKKKKHYMTSSILFGRVWENLMEMVKTIICLVRCLSNCVYFMLQIVLIMQLGLN